MNAPAIGQRVRRASGPVADGQIGFIVATPEGGVGVRLDRKAEELVVRYNPTEWQTATENPLQPMQIARIAYEADRALRQARGEYGVTDWIAMKEGIRVEWLQGGGPPVKDAERRALYMGILRALAAS